MGGKWEWVVESGAGMELVSGIWIWKEIMGWNLGLKGDWRNGNSIVSGTSDDFIFPV